MAGDARQIPPAQQIATGKGFQPSPALYGEQKINAAKQLWRKHLEAPFPTRCYDEVVLGVDLVQIDAFVAGCAMSVIEEGRAMEPGHAEIMDQCRAGLATALRSLEGEEKEYFTRVDQLAEFVLSAR
jgi:hypothetical protein